MMFTFPERLSEKYRPRTIEGFAGLPKVKTVVVRWVYKPYPVSWLAIGAPGTGKTSMGLAIAEQIVKDARGNVREALGALEVELLAS
jgi:replication-associated recombination protein RarA